MCKVTTRTATPLLVQQRHLRIDFRCAARSVQHATSATSVSNKGTVANVNGSNAFTPKSNEVIKRVSANDDTNPIANTKQRQLHSLAQHQQQNVRARRTEREPHDAGFQTRDHRKVMSTAIRKVFRSERERDPQPFFSLEPLKTRPHHADNDMLSAVEQDRAVQDVAMACKADIDPSDKEQSTKYKAPSLFIS